MSSIDDSGRCPYRLRRRVAKSRSSLSIYTIYIVVLKDIELVVYEPGNRKLLALKAIITISVYPNYILYYRKFVVLYISKVGIYLKVSRG